MPRRRGPPQPRPRPRPRLPPGDRDRRLAEEVLYLHSLWRRGPPAPAQIQARSARRESSKRKRRRLDHAAAAATEPQDTGAEWALPPSPPNSSPKTWPEATPASFPFPAKPPPPPTSPRELAQREALRAAAEFFSNRGSSSSDDDDGSESEGEQDAAGFITGLFERDAALRGHYERGWEEGQFACVACAGGTRKAGRRFRGCVALVQHTRAATRYGRTRAHRALAAVVCRVLGWDIGRLPSVVIDPRGTLGQALAAEATADVQLAKENDDTGENNDSLSDEDEEEDVETGMEDSSTDGDEEDNELESSEYSAEKEDVDTGMEDSSTDGDEEANELESNKESTEKEDVKTGLEDSKSADGDKEAIEPDSNEKIAEKENMEEIIPPNCEEISKTEVCWKEMVQEVNANKDDCLIQYNYGEVHEQDMAKESAEQENTNNVT